MALNDFSTSILVNQSPSEVFRALLNVRGWWSGLFGETVEGASEKPGDEFSFLAGGGLHETRQQLIELIPDKKVAWRVISSNLSFVPDPREWEGTVFGFELTEEQGKTRITFTHRGLTPALECYESCAPAWTRYVHDQRLNLKS